MYTSSTSFVGCEIKISFFFGCNYHFESRSLSHKTQKVCVFITSSSRYKSQANELNGMQYFVYFFTAINEWKFFHQFGNLKTLALFCLDMVGGLGYEVGFSRGR